MKPLLLLKPHVLSGVLCTFIITACGGSANSDKSAQDAAPQTPVMSNEQQKIIHTIPDVSKKWRLVWADEFEQAEIDDTKWSFERNCFGGGNNEKQCYTDRADNALIENGVLVIKALREDYTGPAALDDSPDYNTNITRTQPYTSARLRTVKKGDWRYGRFEIKAKLPYGQGTWPAIWMLPTDWVYGDWAGSGEIDIMEAVNLHTAMASNNPNNLQAENRVHGTLHYGRKAPENVYSGTYYDFDNDPTSEPLNPADDFHVYAIEWQEGEIRWYVDGIHYATQTQAQWYNQYVNETGELVDGSGAAPFDQPFHLLINFAVGGNWPETVNEKGIDASVFPQRFEIDFVRIYECSVSIDTGRGCETVGNNPQKVVGHIKPN